MKLTKHITVSAALVALGMTVSPVMAYEEMSNEVGKGDAGGFIGLGAHYSPDYEGGDDYEAGIAAFGRYNWGSGRYVSLGGTSGSEKAVRLRANLVSTDQSDVWEFGPLLQYRLERDDVDNNMVDRLNDVDAATELGVYGGFKSGPWAAGVGFVADVSSEHDGYLVYMKGKYDIVANDSFSMNLGAHVTYADEEYMDTYFGVNGNESVRTGLPVYNADSGFKDVGIGLTAHYRFTKTWGLMGNVGYTRMLSDAEDSPLVDGVGDENQYSGVVAVTYSF